MMSSGLYQVQEGVKGTLRALLFNRESHFLFQLVFLQQMLLQKTEQNGQDKKGSN